MLYQLSYGGLANIEPQTNRTMKYVCQQEKVKEYEMEINLFNDEINYPANKQQCKGLFWKRPVSTFLSSLRSIESRISLGLLKG